MPQASVELNRTPKATFSACRMDSLACRVAMACMPVHISEFSLLLGVRQAVSICQKAHWMSDVISCCRTSHHHRPTIVQHVIWCVYKNSFTRLLAAVSQKQGPGNHSSPP